MRLAQFQRVIFALAAMVAVSACVKTPGAADNPFRPGSNAYSALPYQDGEKIHILATGELHYNQ